jgi:hypothetical protein
MSSLQAEEIPSFDVVYAIRTGVTVLMPKIKTLDCDASAAVLFKRSPDNPDDVLITAQERCAILRGMKKDHLKAAIDRGVMMFYEMQGEDVVRCTPCRYMGA